MIYVYERGYLNDSHIIWFWGCAIFLQVEIHLSFTINSLVSTYRSINLNKIRIEERGNGFALRIPCTISLNRVLGKYSLLKQQ